MVRSVAERLASAGTHAKVATRISPELVDTLAPNIRLLGMVGEGGMAYVFVGRDAVLKRQVAVKLLSPSLADDPVSRKRFTREAEAIAAVSNPNIVNVYQVGELPKR